MGAALRRIITTVGTLWLVVVVGHAAAGATVAPAATSANLNLPVRAAGAGVVIRVNTLGGPPVATASDPIWLVNDEGLSLTKVWVLSPRSPRCQSAPVHFVPIGPAPYTSNSDWCLDIRLPPYGSQVAGVLHGSRAAITITVEHQAAWGWPIFWAALGLTIALAVILLSSARFSALAPGFRLHLIVWKEARKRLEREPRKIQGLTHNWRRDARSAGQDLRSPSFISSVAAVVKHGADREDRARQRLREALRARAGDQPRPEDGDAEDEAARRDYQIADFFDDHFRPTAVPAERLLAAGHAGALAAPATEGRGIAGPARRGFIQDIVILSVQFIPMIVAGGSALASVYLTNKTFGTWTDYLALTLATAGSSAVAAGAAAIFRVLTPASGSVTAFSRGPSGPPA